MKPIYIHSGMVGAPQYANADGNINAIFEACLINGFNSRTATSATASGGVLTLNFASDPGFEALQTVEVAVSNVALVNGQHRVLSNSNNQVTIAIAGLPDGTVGSSGAGITIKQAGAGWSKPYSNATTAVFRPPSGSRRYLRCVSSVNADFLARGFEDMTGVDTGTNPFPTFAQSGNALALYQYSYGSSSGSPWFMVVSGKWLIFSMANAPVIAYTVGAIFFGDLAEPVIEADPFAAILFGMAGGFISRKYDGVTLSVQFYQETNNLAASWPLPVAQSVRFLPYMIIKEQSNSFLRGVFPNLYRVNAEIHSNQFGTIFSNVQGIDGRLLLLGDFGVPNSTYRAAIALDAEAW